MDSALIRALDDRERVASALDPIAANNYFFLNLAMSACKATLDAANGIPFSSVVTTMALNSPASKPIIYPESGQLHNPVIKNLQTSCVNRPRRR